MSEPAFPPQTGVFWRYRSARSWNSGYCSVDIKTPDIVKMGRWPGDSGGLCVKLSDIVWKYKGPAA